VQGRWVESPAGSFALPAPPLDVDAGPDGLEVLYPYVWQTYRDGELASVHDLPSRARAIHARPEPIVMLEKGFFTPERGWLSLPATDAVRTGEGVFWVNEEGLWHERELVADGSYERVLAVGDEVLVLGREHALAWPAEREIELPLDWFAADSAADLYLLSPAGVHRLDPAGYEMGFYAGNFSDLAVSAGAGVWLVTKEGQTLHLTLELEKAW